MKSNIEHLAFSERSQDRHLRLFKGTFADQTHIVRRLALDPSLIATVRSCRTSDICSRYCRGIAASICCCIGKDQASVSATTCCARKCCSSPSSSTRISLRGRRILPLIDCTTQCLDLSQQSCLLIRHSYTKQLPECQSGFRSRQGAASSSKQARLISIRIRDLD